MLDLLFFAFFAIFIGAKLFQALGKKDYDHKEHRKAAKQQKPQTEDNVIQGGFGSPQIQEAQIQELIKAEDINPAIDLNDKPLSKEMATKVDDIRKYDDEFSAKQFLQGANTAFEMIIEAFANGDKRTLKQLLSKDVYQGFSADIDKRASNDISRETTIISVDEANIDTIELKNKKARITIQFISKQINLIKDKTGNVVEGHPSKVEEVDDLWTFARNLTSSNPNWELVETH